MNPMNVGWSCPRCSRVYAPSVTSCASCNAIHNQPWIAPHVPTEVPFVPLPYTPTPSVPWTWPAGKPEPEKYFLNGGVLNVDWTNRR